ncbi:helix-turn-helix domain-containing protein, partial [Leuconostoc mesenteroides]
RLFYSGVRFDFTIYHSQTHTVKSTAEAFNISARTVQYIKKLFN